MKTKTTFILLASLFFALGLSGCGSSPESAKSLSDTMSFPRLKKAEDLGYSQSGSLCAQVVTAMYNSQLNICVIALDSCQGAFLESKRFEADAHGLCEIAE